ncbi:ATP-binding protein [Nocardia rhamnosiphila]|uniref:MalT-like TPR region domain-containing protein n=1 Tax=Nocardia rhamnosiphila TaxID=426716 RepID=A0ABV2WZ01_9NOCA
MRFSPLAELTQPGLLVPALIAAVGAPSASGSGIADQSIVALSALIGSRKLLLVLDNCEHLIEPCAHIVGLLLAACPNLRVLATSRESLRVDGEVVVRVLPLALPPPGEAAAPGVSARYEAVELFLDRVSMVNPDFVLDASNEQSVVALCERLDGLPLAIELAAAATRALPLQTVSAGAGDPFDILISANRSGPARHKTMRATIDCSYQLCSAPAQKLWARMSVFRGGAVLRAVKTVCSDPVLDPGTVEEALVELVDKSLVSFDGRRYRMLEIIRHYGQERLCLLGEEYTMRLAHLDWFAAAGAEFDEGWYVGDQRTLSGRMLADHANIRAALEFCVDEPHLNRFGLRVASDLFGFWLTAASSGEGRHWLDRLFSRDETPSPERAAALWIASLFTTLDGDAVLGIELADQCIRLARRFGDRDSLAHAVQVRGFGQSLLGETSEAIATLEEAVRLESELPSFNPHLARAYLSLGIALCSGGRLAEAERALDEGHTFSVCCGDELMASWSTVFLGLVALLDGRVSRADALLTEALESKRALGDTLGISYAVEFLAWVALTTGDAERAARLIGASESVSDMFGPHLAGFARFIEWHRRYVDKARDVLGTREFDAVTEGGAHLRTDEIISYALGERIAQ